MGGRWGGMGFGARGIGGRSKEALIRRDRCLWVYSQGTRSAPVERLNKAAPEWSGMAKNPPSGRPSSSDLRLASARRSFGDLLVHHLFVLGTRPEMSGKAFWTRAWLRSGVTQAPTDCGDMQGVEERTGELVVSCRDGTIVLQMADHGLSSCPRPAPRFPVR